MTSNKPVAVLISDIHYNLKTLELADASLRKAIDKANDLKVPLIVAGDLHDTKANMRAECMNAMIDTFALADIQPYVIRGNHDSINEKSVEHSLNFLGGLASIVCEDKPYKPPGLDVLMLPYYNNKEKLLSDLIQVRTNFVNSNNSVPLIMHQGLQESDSGEYIQDKTAISKKDIAGFKFNIISGHYHKRQTIKLDEIGTWRYIGNPYTLNFAEANDPAKGFQVLYDDGSLRFTPTNFRRHIVLNVEKVKDYWQITGKVPLEDVGSNDLVWAKFRSTKEDLARIDRKLAESILYPAKNIKIDLIPTDSQPTNIKDDTNISKEELLDSTIQGINTTSEQKQRLKDLWRRLETN